MGRQRQPSAEQARALMTLYLNKVAVETAIEKMEEK